MGNLFSLWLFNGWILVFNHLWLSVIINVSVNHYIIILSSISIKFLKVRRNSLIR